MIEVRVSDVRDYVMAILQDHMQHSEDFVAKLGGDGILYCDADAAAPEEFFYVLVVRPARITTEERDGPG